MRLSLVAAARLSAASLVSLAALASFAACSRDKRERAADAGARDAAPRVVVADASPDAGRGEVRALAAANFRVSVCDRPGWPESDAGARRLGYLRNGAVVDAYDRPIPNDDCTSGWYELVSGGFVCGKAVTFDMSNPRVRLAPKQPDLDSGTPYRYGVNLVDGTPLYRRVLTLEDRKKYEPELNPPEPVSLEESSDTDARDAGDRDAKADDAPKDDEADDDEKDAGTLRLKDLKGHGVLVRKMVRGFFLALDRDFKAAGGRWWRTTYGFAVPFDRIMVQPVRTKHRGTWFGPPPGEALDASAGPALDASTIDAASFVDAGAVRARAVAFVKTRYARELRPAQSGKRMVVGPPVTRRTAVLLTGRAVKVAGGTYHETAAGFFVRLSDLTLARPEPPEDLAPSEKWIDVDLTRQALVAFEGARPVFATLVSTGRRNRWDEEKDFPTPTGTFHIKAKHVTTTMDGDVAADGPYSIEDVPWVMYFQGSYALHGAFWHDAFGHKRSHGCVNLAPEAARVLFQWSDPPLPSGWHGVFAADDAHGTRIVIHEDPEKNAARRGAR